jgi:hypothetical protein
MRFSPPANLVRRSHSPEHPSLFRVAPLLLLLWACSAVRLGAQQPTQAASIWESAAREFVAKLAAAGSVRGNGTLSVQNMCSLDAPTAALIEHSLLLQLNSRGFRFIPPATGGNEPPSPSAPPNQASIDIRVTLSENLSGFIWIAELRTSSGKKIVMLAVAAPPGISANETRPVPLLERTIVWRQPEPILDFAIVGATPETPAQLIVLSPERVAFYNFQQDTWRLAASSAIEHTHPWPRDLRGRIEVDWGKLSVYLPGIFCTGTMGTELGLYCAPGEEKMWPVDGSGLVTGPVSHGGSLARLDPTRDYFLDALPSSNTDGAKFAPFYSAALQTAYDLHPVILAGLDSSAQLHEGGDEITAHFSSWGSDIASLNDACAGPSPVLVTGTGDDTSTDTIQLYQIGDRQAAAVGQPISFAGPVRALWAAGGGDSARAISQNLQTGAYEASSISISCPR